MKTRCHDWEYDSLREKFGGNSTYKRTYKRDDSMNLGTRIVLGIVVVPVLVAAMLSLPAGTLRFWQGWAFMAVVFVPVISVYVYFYQHDPRLVEHRLQSREKVSEQKPLIRWLKPVFFAAFLLPGLDYRSACHIAISSWLC